MMKATLFILDRFSISVDGYQELTQLHSSLPRTHQTQHVAKGLGSKWNSCYHWIHKQKSDLERIIYDPPEKKMTQATLRASIVPAAFVASFTPAICTPNVWHSSGEVTPCHVVGLPAFLMSGIYFPVLKDVSCSTHSASPSTSLPPGHRKADAGWTASGETRRKFYSPAQDLCLLTCSPKIREKKWTTGWLSKCAHLPIEERNFSWILQLSFWCFSNQELNKVNEHAE